MELTINIENKKMYDSFVQFFKALGVKIVSFNSADKKTKKYSGGSVLRLKPKGKFKREDVNDAALLSEKALAEEWNSKDDDRWDKVL